MATDKRTGGGAGGGTGRQRADATGAAGGSASETSPRQIQTDADAATFINGYANAIYPNLTLDQQEGIRYYQTAFHTQINRALRNPESTTVGPFLRAIMGNLATAVAQSSLPEDVVLHRGWGNGPLGTTLKAQAANGSLRAAIENGTAVFADAAYSSTSVLTSVPASIFRQGGITSRIVARAGQQGLPVRSGDRDGDAEREILLKPGQRQRIVDYTVTPEGRLILDIVLED